MFDGLVTYPRSHVIGAAAELCRQRGIEAVLSIGGGSAPHTAKLVVYLSKSPGWLDDIYGIYLPPASGCRFCGCRPRRPPDHK
ncbi:iron-containing alcohol dehydrogenase [Rhizobium laguerreae]|uniref:iron-containing alcohol dehydrogenase n=1 Tax=Rhizobium laguerreae TaxID=1076926 RepID=UPI0028ACC39E|nr:iron-containing alcohol dehydrogenase [Rhizobium laguerreae]